MSLQKLLSVKRNTSANQGSIITARMYGPAKVRYFVSFPTMKVYKAWVHVMEWIDVVYSLEPELAEVFVLQAGPAKSIYLVSGRYSMDNPKPHASLVSQCTLTLSNEHPMRLPHSTSSSSLHLHKISGI